MLISCYWTNTVLRTPAILEDLLFDYNVTTDIDGVTVIAGVMSGEMKTNRDGEEKYWPARYFSLFDVGVYHCAVETQGQVSEDTFTELNNNLIDCLSKSRYQVKKSD